MELNVYAEELTDEAIDLICGMYNDAYSEIIDYLSDVLDYDKNPNFSKIPLNEVLNTIYGILDDLGADIEIIAANKIEEAVEMGYSENEYAYLLAIGIVKSLEEIFEETGADKVIGVSDSLIKETVKDLVNATDNAKFTLTQLIKETFSKHNALSFLVGANTVLSTAVKNQITSTGLKLSIQNGVIGIVDRAGRRWKLHTYVDMLVKTKYHQARVQGMKEFYRKNGYGDLAIIPRVGSIDDCANFEGAIISLSGDNPDYPSYDELQDTNMIFHPRCRHIPIPIYDIDALSDKDYEYWEEHEDEFEDILEDYMDDY